MNGTKQDLTLSRICPSDSAWQCAENLYLSAFPANERRSVGEWRQLSVENPRFSVLSILNGDDFCGFISVWDFTTLRYVEHFAIEPRLRGKHIGSKVLRRLQDIEPALPIVLEVEPPCDELTARRVRFYESNGYVLSSLPYQQPPYDGTEWFPLCLMSTDNDFLRLCFSDVKNTIYHYVYGVINPTIE